jgi:hypothetical protein
MSQENCNEEMNYGNWNSVSTYHILELKIKIFKNPNLCFDLYIYNTIIFY